MAKPLFDEEDDHSEDQIQVNKSFANAYTSRKQKEELRNAQYDDNTDDSSSDESEDEHAELLTTSLDVTILKTIQALRTKDQSIYDPTKVFFAANENLTANTEQEEKHDKKRFKDVIREQILDQMDQEENGVAMNKDNDTKHRLEYDKEQSELKAAFLESTKEDDEPDDWMIVKSRSKPTAEDEDALQKEYEALEKIKPTKSNISDPRGEVEDGEQFLLDFLKHKKWMEKDDSNEYDEEPIKKNPLESDDESLDQLDKADDYESTYNFRFEQADATATSGADFSVVPYARAGSMTTLRRKDETRKLQRETRKERKAAEREAKEQQLKRLKNAKRQEMEERLNEIKKVMGVAGNLDEDAMLKLMEGDFDPEKFEQIMQEQYGDEFYQDEDPQWKSDADVRQALLQDEDGKALVGEDDLEGGLYDEQPDYDENSDVDANDEDGYIEGDEHPEETPMEKKLKEKMEDELYKLDYEDIVAGMPTRFKYRKVEPNDFGLTTQEILFARDSTLKNFVSLKKMAPYKDDGEHFVGSKKRRKFREMLKADLEEAMAEEGVLKEDETVPQDSPLDPPAGDKKKRRQKKGKKRGTEDVATMVNIVTETVSDEHIVIENADIGNQEAGAKKRRKKARSSGEAAVEDEILPVRSVDNETEPLRSAPSTNDDAKPKKTKQKRKQNDATFDRKKRSKAHKKFTAEGISESRLNAFGL